MLDNLDFLQTLQFVEVAKNVVVRTSKGDLCPTEGHTLRVWSDGSIYPSMSLVKDYNLEYQTAEMLEDIETFPNGEGNGLEIFNIRDWVNIPEAQRAMAPNLLLVSVTPRTYSKLDIFANVKREQGVPKYSVSEQGATTYGSTKLLPLLKEVYGVTVEKGEYVDLEIVTSKNQKHIAPNGIFVFPKTVVSKKDKTETVAQETRKGVDIFPLVIKSKVKETTLLKEEPVVEVLEAE